MLSLPLSIKITGATDASNRVALLNRESVAQLRKASEKRAEQTLIRFRTEMAREYTSSWATGRIARGITYKTVTSSDGIQIQFLIPEQRELQYITAALGGHFQHFPVGPFAIVPSASSVLTVPLPGSLSRRFLRGRGGRFSGSRAGNVILVKRVLWGRKTGGFSRDVISEVSAEEGELFVQDVQAAVGIAIQQATG